MHTRARPGRRVRFAGSAGHISPLTSFNAFPYFSDVRSFEKSSTTPAGRDRLRHEAAMLSRARHPGVVTLLRVDERPDRTTLVLARPSDTTLAAAPPSNVVVVMRLVAAMAATVADLHRLGVAHRRLRPDHVLLAGGRPVLCGFAGATGEATDADRAADDTALRELVDLLVTHSAGAGRAGRRLRSLTVSDPRGAPLAAAELARRAGKLVARTRAPSLRRATGAGPAADAGAQSGPVGDLAGADVARDNTPVGRAPAPDPHGRVAAPPVPAIRPARRRVAAVLVGPVVVVAALGWNARPAGHESATLTAGIDTPPAPHTPAATTTSGSNVATGGAPNDSTPATGVTDRDRDRTSDRPTVAAPVRVHAGGATYEVGREGDQLVVADWRCTGEPAAVLLRPSTGELFAFDALPDAAAPVTGRHLATVAGAREIVTDLVGQACPPLAVRDTAGTTSLIGAP